MLVRALRLLAGAAAGILFWWFATPVYNAAIASAAEQLLRFDKRLCGPRAEPVKRNVFVQPRDCVAPTATMIAKRNMPSPSPEGHRPATTPQAYCEATAPTSR